MSAPGRIDYRRAAVGLRARWLYASGAAVALMALAISGLALAEISNQPLYLSSNVDPNIMLIIDDSGSMDSEVLLPTNDGALWWHIDDQSFVGRNAIDVTTSGGVLNYNKTGSANSTWKKYVYLFPNGTATGSRIYSDGDNDHYAIPPIGPFAYLRSSDYNGVYYNPLETYAPWVSSGSYAFSNANPSSARSDPARGTGTLNLIIDCNDSSDNWKFRVHAGMVIPKGTKYNGSTLSADKKIDATASSSVEYYPATYYLKTLTGTYSVGTLTGSCSSPDSSHYIEYVKGPSTFVSSDADALAPDGRCLKRYEIKSGNTFPSGRDYDQEKQNFANWFTYYRKRHLSLRGGAGKSFEDIKDVRVGGFTINDIDTWPNDLHGMWDIDTNRADFYSFLYTAVGSGGTPNRQALKYAGRQFNENANVITQKCQLNFALLCTDGFATLWTGAGVDNADGGMGSPYEDSYGNTLADIAMYYYGTRLRSTGTTTALASGWVPTPSACGKTGTPAWVDCNDDLHMVTFGVTLGAEGNIFGKTRFDVDDAYVTPTPAWADPNLERSPDQVDDLYHATINARGEMFSAKNPAELQESLSDALSQMIGRQVSTAASIATNTTRLGTDTMIYQAKFNSDDWSGQLVAYKVNADGTVGDVAWDSDDADQIPSHASRHIYTWKGSSGTTDPVGLEFTAGNWDYLPSDQQTALFQTDETADDGKARINWIRGDDSVKLTDNTSLRSRAKLLGDIVNSDPAFVGKSYFRYDRLPDGVYGQSTYLAFQAGTSSRRKMLYLGANDGMLHGFDAETGVEQFAYIPKGVFSNLASLTDPGYSHSYFVDGSPYVGDAYIDNQWKTVLVGSTGAGGRSVFALDVTYMNLNGEIYEPVSNYFGAAKVLWEFTDADLGYPIGQPVVGRMPTGQWVAIFGNGYDSDNHGAFLFIVDLATGESLAKIEAPMTDAEAVAGARNGLATPALIANSNRTIQY
ncbi:MAG: PilC/PilY family type IV pilus protein, partial [Methylobacter sp.]